MDEAKTLKENVKDAHSPAEFWLGEIKDSKSYFKKWKQLKINFSHSRILSLKIGEPM